MVISQLNKKYDFKCNLLLNKILIRFKADINFKNLYYYVL